HNPWRRALCARRDPYSTELLRPATPTLRWRWAGRTTPSCLQSSVWRDWARTWRKHEPGTKRPRALAQRKQHGGWPFLQIVISRPCLTPCVRSGFRLRRYFDDRDRFELARRRGRAIGVVTLRDTSGLG